MATLTRIPYRHFAKNDAVHLGRTTCRPAGMAEGFRARDAAKARYIFMVKDLIRFT